MFLKNFITPADDTVKRDATLQNVVDKMTQFKLHHIVILDNKTPLGIITEKDIVNCFKNKVDFSRSASIYATKNLITLHGTRLIQYALSIMVDNNIRKIIVINSKSEYLGCIEQEDIIYKFEEEIHSPNISIHQLINTSNEAKMIDENKSLKDTLEVMSSNNLSSLLIKSSKNEPIGIISESDILRLAQQNVDQNLPVKDFMHYPIISIGVKSSVNDMILLMKEKNIRRVVVHDSEYNLYHIVNSQDLANNLKGNYTKFLETKLHDTRETFNILRENVIELVDIDSEQIIYWTNKTTKINFNINIDDNITNIIPSEIWSDLLKKLIKERFISETIEIDSKFYHLKAHYGNILDDNIIKLFLHDITDITLLTKELEKENQLKEKLLFEQAKMVQLGQMIGNIAHQWRQPLNSISTSSTGLNLKKEMGLLSDEDFYALTSHITTNAEYLSETVDIFRNFIKEKKEFKLVCLQDRISTALKIIKATLKNKHINLIDNIDYKNKIMLNLVTGELEQVLINILNNAKDELISRTIKNPQVLIDVTEEESKVSITIEDNAGGIKEEILPRIFDEYFTTKQDNEGTGLGLYMSKKIIEDSLKGKLYVENSKRGAKFFIELPII